MYNTIYEIVEKIQPEKIALLPFDRNGGSSPMYAVNRGLDYAEVCFAFLCRNGTWMMKYVDEHKQLHDSFDAGSGFIVSLDCTPDGEHQEFVLTHDGHRLSSHKIEDDPLDAFNEIYNELGELKQQHDDGLPEDSTTVRIKNLIYINNVPS